MDADENEDEEEDEVDGEEPECPYCRATDECEHLLLLVDMTFRELQGGTLQEQVQEKWSAALERGENDPLFDESEAFEELLEPVQAIANCELSWDVESGPGQSGSCQAYFCSGAGGAKKAAKKYAAADSSEGPKPRKKSSPKKKSPAKKRRRA